MAFKETTAKQEGTKDGDKEMIDMKKIKCVAREHEWQGKESPQREVKSNRPTAGREERGERNMDDIQTASQFQLL